MHLSLGHTRDRPDLDDRVKLRGMGERNLAASDHRGDVADRGRPVDRVTQSWKQFGRRERVQQPRERCASPFAWIDRLARMTWDSACDDTDHARAALSNVERVPRA